MALTILLITTSLAVSFFGTWPQVQASIEMWRTYEASEAKVKSLAAKNRQLQDVLDPTLLDQINTVDSLLPSRKPLIELLTAVNVLSKQTQVVITSVELRPGAIATDGAKVSNRGQLKKGDSDTLEINMIVSGTLSQVNQFFNTIERTTPLTTITSLSLTPKDRNTALVSTDTIASLQNRAYQAELTLAASYFTRPVSANLDASLPQLSSDQTKLISDLKTFTVNKIDPQTQILGGGLEDLFKTVKPEIVTIGE